LVAFGAESTAHDSFQEQEKSAAKRKELFRVVLIPFVRSASKWMMFWGGFRFYLDELRWMAFLALSHHTAKAELNFNCA
jgi:hypothetical protein